MSILEATIKDAEAIAKLVNSAYRGEASREGWTHEADLFIGDRTDATRVEAIIMDKESSIYKYMEQDEILACVLLQKQSDAMYLGMLSILPALQGRGIGKKLLSFAESVATTVGCGKMKMTVIEKRKELVAWYLRHGYYDTGMRETYEPDELSIALEPIVFCVLEKKLPR